MSENVSAEKSAKVSAAGFGGKGVAVAIVVAAILTVGGLALWAFQLTSGMVNTNMRNLDSWGLYITMFMFLVGLSAGGLIVSSAPRVFGMEGFGGVSKIAVWTSICCTVLAIGFVVIDLGQPLRLWELFVYSNLGSPLMWDIIVLGTYLILSVVYLWAMLRFEGGKGSAAALRVVSAIALVCAVLVHSVTAWIFGLQQGREMWHTALLGPWFVSSALVCGVALVLVVVIALRKAGYLELAQEHVVKMLKLLGVFVMVDLYFFGCDLLTEGFPAGSGAEVVAMLTTGPLAPFFWIEVVGCAVTAVIAFVPKLRTNPLIVIAAGGRFPDPEPRYARRRVRSGSYGCGCGSAERRRIDGVLSVDARIRRRAGRFRAGRAHAAAGPQVSPVEADRAFALDTIRFSAGRPNHRAPRRATWRGGERDAEESDHHLGDVLFRGGRRVRGCCGCESGGGASPAYRAPLALPGRRVRVGVVPWFRRCARAGWRARDGLSRGGLRQRRVPCVGHAGDALSPRVRCQLEPLDLGAGRTRRAACSDRAKALRGEVTW